MDITELIRHPDRMDRDTLYELRAMLALYPYFQTARLLLLQNLFLLHDPTFDQELRRAAIYITDRKVLFQMIEAAHYQLSQPSQAALPALSSTSIRKPDTISLINDFLDSLPTADADEQADEGKARRKPTPADAAVDYVAYLMETESQEERDQAAQAPQLIGQDLIDSFIQHDNGKIHLNENPLLKPQLDISSAPVAEETEQVGNSQPEQYFTQTLARIYIKQGNYSKALEIIRQLSLHNPKKNAYFADQIRFLEKLIINNNKK